MFLSEAERLFLLDVLLRGASKKAVHNCRLALDAFVDQTNDIETSSLTIEDVRRFVAEAIAQQIRERELSRAKVGKTYAKVRAFVVWMKRRDLCTVKLLIPQRNLSKRRGFLFYYDLREGFGDLEVNDSFERGCQFVQAPAHLDKHKRVAADLSVVDAGLDDTKLVQQRLFDLPVHASSIQALFHPFFFPLL